MWIRARMRRSDPTPMEPVRGSAPMHNEALQREISSKLLDVVGLLMKSQALPTVPDGYSYDCDQYCQDSGCSSTRCSVEGYGQRPLELQVAAALKTTSLALNKSSLGRVSISSVSTMPTPAKQEQRSMSQKPARVSSRCEPLPPTPMKPSLRKSSETTGEHCEEQVEEVLEDPSISSSDSRRRAVSQAATSRPSFYTASFEVQDEELPLPPTTDSWDWPLSRPEKKSRVNMLDKQILRADCKALEAQVQQLQIATAPIQVPSRQRTLSSRSKNEAAPETLSEVTFD